MCVSESAVCVRVCVWVCVRVCACVFGYESDACHVRSCESVPPSFHSVSNIITRFCVCCRRVSRSRNLPFIAHVFLRVDGSIRREGRRSQTLRVSSHVLSIPLCDNDPASDS